MSEPLLQVSDLVQEFAVRARGGTRVGVVHAVSGVSFQLEAGETLGLVGETGSGKSTLARAVMQAPPPRAGSVRLRGIELVGLKHRRLLQARRQMQMIFQDPFGSLDPKWRVARIVEEPLVAFGIDTRQGRRRRAATLLERVGLDPGRFADRRPRELSGGQAQRVAIARALALDPALIICDEAVASLDVLIRAQVLNLLEELRAELGLAYLFISHDLALVKQVSDRVAVMYLGKLVEIGPAEKLYRRPLHPYTVALLASIPKPDPTARRVPVARTIRGEQPSPIDPPSGCRFRTRCPRAQEVCALREPPLRELDSAHVVACHFPVEDRDRELEATAADELGGRAPAASASGAGESAAGGAPVLGNSVGGRGKAVAGGELRRG